MHAGVQMSNWPYTRFFEEGILKTHLELMMLQAQRGTKLQVAVCAFYGKYPDSMYRRYVCEDISWKWDLDIVGPLRTYFPPRESKPECEKRKKPLMEHGDTQADLVQPR